ncbi:hypothetical protein BY458DRAFT_527652 [Sporodiniella umbellata]|nr:hypothetical protein BY458DRAFT_527652 [Sporodiniella umbellata]
MLLSFLRRADISVLFFKSLSFYNTMSLQDDLFDILEINTKEVEPKETTVPQVQTQHSKSAIDDFLEELLDIPIETRAPSPNFFSTQEEEAIWGDFDDNAFLNLNDSSPIEEKKISEKDITLIGFTTGSGKALKPVSEESLKKAQAFLSECANDVTDSLRTESTSFSGFKTASGKELKPVSKESLRKAQNLLKEEAPLEIPTEKYNVHIQEFSGFKTASGKQLKPISPAALEKAKMLLVDDLNNSPVEQLDKTKPQTDTVSKNDHSRTLTTNDRDTKNATAFHEVMTTGTKRILENVERVSLKGRLQDISNAKRLKGSIFGKKNKPFKSPIIRSNIELTKAAIENKNNSRIRDATTLNSTLSSEYKQENSDKT